MRLRGLGLGLGIILLTVCGLFGGTAYADNSLKLWRSIDTSGDFTGAYTTRVGTTSEGDPFVVFAQSLNSERGVVGDSRWISANVRGPHWIEVDFGVVQMVNQIKLHFFENASGSYFLKDYKLQAWSGNAWVDLISVTDNTEKNPIYSFTPINAQKIRLFVLHSGPDQMARLWGIEVLDLYGKNVAWSLNGATARADSFLTPNHIAEMAIDRHHAPYIGNKWQNDGAIEGPHWFMLDFGLVQSFQEIRMMSHEPFPNDLNDFRLEYNNGTVEEPDWVTIAEETGYLYPDYYVTFPEIAAQQVRLVVTKARNNAANVRSFKVYDRTTDTNIAKEASASASSVREGASPQYALESYDVQEISSLTTVGLDGETMFQFGVPDENNRVVGSDLPIQLYDIDLDGESEIITVLHDKLQILSPDGEIKRSTVLPIQGDSLFIANIRGTSVAQDIVIKDRYRRVRAYDPELNLLWSFDSEDRYLGHTAVPYDLDGDGKDEVVVGDYVLDHDGQILYTFEMGSDHSDSIKVTDTAAASGGTGIAFAHSDNGLHFYGSDGSKYAEDVSAGHAQKLIAGDFYPHLLGTEYMMTTSSVREVNLARLPGTTISSDSELGVYTANKAIDGNKLSRASRWVSENTPGPHWLKIDFGEERWFNDVRLYFYLDDNEKYYLQSYQLQYNEGSVEEPQWVDIAAISGSSDQSVVRHQFEPVRAREFRLYITNPSSRPNDNYARLIEIDISEPRSPFQASYDAAGQELVRMLHANQSGVLQMDASQAVIGGSGQEYVLIPKFRQLLDGFWNVVAELPSSAPNRFGQSINLAGDGRDELMLWDTDRVEIYTNTSVLPDGGRNLVQSGATVTADSVLDAVYHAPGLVGDGNISTSSMWVSANVPGDHWLLVDFSEKQTFDEIWLYGYSDGSRAYYLRDFEIQYNAGTNLAPEWITLHTVRDNVKERYATAFEPVSAKQVRLLITKPNTDGDDTARLLEMEIYAAPSERVNLALHEDVMISADSQFNAGTAPELAIDGESASELSRWLSADTPTDHWLMLDFGWERSFEELRLYFHQSPAQIHYYLKDYQFQYNSGTVESPIWTDLIVVADNQEQQPVYRFSPVMAQQVRLYITNPSTAGDSIARLYEIEVFETSRILNVDDVKASSEYSSSHTAHRVTDGDKNTYWRSGVGGNANWLTLDLGDTVMIDQIDLHFMEPGQGLAADFKLQYNSGTSLAPVWTDIAVVLANDKMVRKFAFNPLEARQIRLLITAADPASHSVAVAEVEIRGADDYPYHTLENTILPNTTKASHGWTNY